jgi:hypothetical protein
MKSCLRLTSILLLIPLLALLSGCAHVLYGASWDIEGEVIDASTGELIPNALVEFRREPKLEWREISSGDDEGNIAVTWTETWCKQQFLPIAGGGSTSPSVKIEKAGYVSKEIKIEEEISEGVGYIVRLGTIELHPHSNANSS